MATSNTKPKPKAKPASPKTTDARLKQIENRLDALEKNKCSVREGWKTFCAECKIPNQAQTRIWVKENPFLALAIAVLGTALLVSILS